MISEPCRTCPTTTAKELMTTGLGIKRMTRRKRRGRGGGEKGSLNLNVNGSGTTQIVQRRASLDVDNRFSPFVVLVFRILVKLDPPHSCLLVDGCHMAIVPRRSNTRLIQQLITTDNTTLCQTNQGAQTGRVGSSSKQTRRPKHLQNTRNWSYKVLYACRTDSILARLPTLK